jgi:hypothetical protein
MPIRDDPPFVPEELSEHLWNRWRLRRSPRRLAQLRATGEGPPFMQDGCVVRYARGTSDDWAKEQLGEPCRSTAEETARRLLGQQHHSRKAP